MIVLFIAQISLGVVIYLIFFAKKATKAVPCRLEQLELGQSKEPFSVAEYMDRIDRAQVEILSNQKPVDQTIILWWGLDGLRLNEDGTLEWITRKKEMPKPPKTVDTSFYPSGVGNFLAQYPSYLDFISALSAPLPQLNNTIPQNTIIQEQEQTQQLIYQMNTCCVQAAETILPKLALLRRENVS